MAKIITENFKIETTNELYGSLNDQNYYIVASTTSTKEEFQSTPAIQNTQVSKRDFMRRVVFGRKISTDNARYMFLERPWVKGTVYDQYDDTKDVENLNMFVSVREEGSGNYLIFKCLDNNNGAQSQEITGTVDPSNYQMAITQDGYRWQFMFKVLFSEVLDFKTSDNLPLPVISTGSGGYGDEKVVAAAEENISNILLTNTTTNQFNQYLFGEATSTANASDVIIIDPDSASRSAFRNITVSVTAKPGRTIYSALDAYKNMYFKADGKIYDVIASVSSPTTNQITLRIKTRDIFSAQQVCQLLIKVAVSNSTLSGKTAKAYLVLDEFGTAKKVDFETRGTEYKFATAEVIYPPLLKTSASVLSNPTTLRAIVSPRGGHGSDPISEMAMSKLSINTSFVGGAVNAPNSNEYSIVGLIKNPTFSDGVNADSFDNRTVIRVSGDHINPAGNVLNGEDSTHTVSTLLTGNAGGVNDYIEQYIKTIDIQQIVDGVSYTIVDPGNMSRNDFTSIGAPIENIESAHGFVFTANIANTILGSEKTALVSTVTDKVDINSATYDYSLDIITARIHELVSDGSDTLIKVVDYDGDFQHKFQKGIFYVKETPSSSVSINNKIAESITYGQYESYSGDLLHFIDFTPIPRDPGRNETVKFTFDF